MRPNALGFTNFAPPYLHPSGSINLKISKYQATWLGAAPGTGCCESEERIATSPERSERAPEKGLKLLTELELKPLATFLY